MKKILSLSLLVLFFAFRGFAQNLPNYGFEDWTNPTTPDGWTIKYEGTINGLLPLSFAFGAKTMDAHSGSYPLKVTPAMLPIGEGFTLPGIVQLGTVGTFNLDMNALTDLMNLDFKNLNLEDLMQFRELVATGYPLSEAPSEVKFWYKFLPDGSDEVRVTVIATQWNSMTNMPEVVASGTSTIAEASYQYQQMNVAMTQTGASPICDTIRVLITVGGLNASISSEFFVDDFLLKFNTWGISDHYESRLLIYPNPTKHFFKVGMIDDRVENYLEVLDGYGRLVLRVENVTLNDQISTSNLTPGVYFVRLTQNNSSLSSKLIIE